MPGLHPKEAAELAHTEPCARLRSHCAQAYLPANTLASFFGGKVKAGDAWKPVGTAKLGEPLCLRSMLLKVLLGTQH